VDSAGGAIVREVHVADAANLSPITSERAGERKASDVQPSTPPARGAMKTARERAEEKREAKLESVREQVREGSLVIHKMTDEERRRYPPRPAPPRRPSRW
jgi:hypothetical protein